MILQSFVFPGDPCGEQELFCRCSGDTFPLPDSRGLLIKGGVSFSNDTYMNFFDWTAWKKYTEIQEVILAVTIRGSGTMEVYVHCGNQDFKIDAQTFDCAHFSTIQIPLRAVEDGYTFFRIHAITDTEFEAAKYLVNDIGSTKDIKLALVICTCQREQQLKKNLGKLLGSRFFDSGSEVFGRLFIRVVDNASAIDVVERENCRIYHNRNTGGSGGFTRGIVETQAEWDEYPATHIILMDDDVEFMEETFYRLYALLSLLKEEYGNEAVAGRMFRMDDRKTQFTASEQWNGGYIFHAGENENMCGREILATVNEERGQYAGWWFAVFPYAFTVDNLPLPFFLHCDDVEYGLRHGGTPIVLNGIQVWHETYEHRQSTILAYYDTRNMAITNRQTGYPNLAKHLRCIWKDNLRHSRRLCDRKRAYLQMVGIRDYFRGHDWFLRVDPEENHRRIVTLAANRISLCSSLYLRIFIGVRFMFITNPECAENSAIKRRK